MQSTTDALIVAELERTFHATKNYAARAHSNSMNAAIEENIDAALGELLEKHDLFKLRGNRYFGRKSLHFNPLLSSRLLINKAQQIGPTLAVHWLRRVYSTEIADVRYVAEVLGLETSSSYALSNGVIIGPIAALPSSQISDAYKAQKRPSAGFFSGFASVSMVYCEVKDVSAADQHSPMPPMIHEVVQAHALVSEHAAPSIGISWAEFMDSDLEDASIGITVSFSTFDAPVRDWQHVKIEQADIRVIESVLCLPLNLRRIMELAASRLIMARNRVSPSNRAIDGCICLEALFTDKGKGELTYKLALRAARLLGDSPEERRSIRKIVKDFYTLRSNGVHGVLVNERSRSRDMETANAGLNVCAKALQKLVELKHIPNWDDVELGE